jgi:hypothetical protein
MPNILNKEMIQLKEQEKVLKSDGSEMDEVASPPGKMFGLFIGLMILIFAYVYGWSFLLGS